MLQSFDFAESHADRKTSILAYSRLGLGRPRVRFPSLEAALR